MPTLFDPITLGDLTLPNRIIMAPLTRRRAGIERVPNDLMREYYTQRASAGLILTEATAVTPMGVGYADTPGIWSSEQTEAWKSITDSVHAAGGRIVLQLWHVGRISHPDFLNGELPVSASDVAPPGDFAVPSGRKPFVAPRPLRLDEIPDIIEDYRLGAINAHAAGFDGVEIHGANGYLPDQFLRDGTNRRTDEYGGSIENRAKFLLEATDAAISVWGNARVGVHLSPRNMAKTGSYDSDPGTVFNYVAEQLGKRQVAFIFTRESVKPEDGERFSPEMKRRFGGNLIANEGFTVEQAQTVLDNGEADAVSWGREFIANPDLPQRIRRGAEFNIPNPETFYSLGAVGYTDYPTLEDGYRNHRQ